MATQSLEIIGLSKETVWGTFVAPTKFIPGIATPSTSRTVTAPTQSRGTRGQVISGATQVTSGIQITGELIPEVMSSLIAGWFGTGGDAMTGSSAVGYTHTLTPQNTLPSFSVEHDEDIYTQILARQFTGCMVSQMTLTHGAGTFSTAQFNLMGQRELTPATPGLPSNPTPAITTLQPFDFSLMAQTIGGSASTQLINATLTCDNQVQNVFSANGQLYPARLQPTQRAVTFSTTSDFLDSSLYTYWAAVAGTGGYVTGGGMSLTLTTQNNIAGASNPYKMQFNLPNLRPQDQYQVTAASDVLQQQLTWSVTQGAGANEVNAVIVNSESSALV